MNHIAAPNIISICVCQRKILPSNFKNAFSSRTKHSFRIRVGRLISSDNSQDVEFPLPNTKDCYCLIKTAQTEMQIFYLQKALNSVQIFKLLKTRNSAALHNKKINLFVSYTRRLT